jgi:hypothetical protein
MQGMAIAMGVLLAALAATPLMSYAQSDDTNTSDQSVQPPDVAVPTPPPSWLATTSPKLACGVRPMPYKLMGASAATFTCWVAGAPADDTSFSIQALRIVDQAGSTRPLATLCDQGALSAGAGACAGSLTDPSGAPLIGGLLISATLQPSGAQLGPVHVSPTLAAGF